MASMLTTVDNPYDPRTEFLSWFAWDVDQGYNTCAYLDRISFIAEDYPQEVIDMQIEEAMDEIVAMHADGLYKKVEIAAA